MVFIPAYCLPSLFWPFDDSKWYSFSNTSGFLWTTLQYARQEVARQKSRVETLRMMPSLRR